MINFLDLNKFKKGLRPVTSAIIFIRPSEFNPEGLFSEMIFGSQESKERKTTFSYIDLNCQVIHPTAYQLLIRLDKKVELFLSTAESFSLDSKGLLQVDPDGVRGITEFIKIFPKIKFRGERTDREKYIEKLNEAYKKKTLFIDTIPIIPVSQRDIYQDEHGKWDYDPINEEYLKIIRRTVQMKSTPKSGPLFDLMNYEVQKIVIAHDQFIRKLIQKKRGLIRSQMLGKRADFTGRAVITSGPNLKVNELGLPFRLAIPLFEPFIIHKIFNTKMLDREQLEKEVKAFTGLELSIDSIKIIFKAIKAGDDLPKNLYDMMYQAAEVAMMGRVVLAKRDPNLHAENIRGFTPIIVPGNTIQVCTLQVGGFNADFDGDSCLSFITYTKFEQNKKCHISELITKEDFVKIEEIEKPNKIIVTKYKPVQDIFIKSINPKTGIIEDKKITEYSKHENIGMYKIHDKQNRFEDFWSSYDHSLIIYDEDKQEIRKISPRELLENPEGKFLIKEKK
jgi:hypothetical protein